MTYLGDDDYSEPYTPDEYTPPPRDTVGYDQPQQPYPGGNYFPPPPVNDQPYHPADPYPPGEGAYNPYPAYNPADYPPESSHAPYEQTRGAYGDSDATLGAPYPTDTFEGDSRYQAPADAPRGRDDSRDRRGRDAGNVSSNNPDASGTTPDFERREEERENSSAGTGHRKEREDAGTSVPG